VTFRTFLAGTDFTPLGDRAVSAAIALADQLNPSEPERSTARVHVAHVLNPATVYMTPLPEAVPPTLLRELEARAFDEAQEKLERLAPTKTPIRLTKQILIGNPARELARAAVAADLVVTSTHGRGSLGRILLGSVASNLIRISSRPVLVTGEDRDIKTPIRSVLAAVDLSAISRHVIADALELISGRPGCLHVVSSIARSPLFEIDRSIRLAEPLPTMEELAVHVRSHLNTIVRSLEIPPEIEVQLHVRFETPRTEILGMAKELEADVVALGTSGHNAIERAILGSTATRVLAEAHCPVLVVPKQ
jgi:nucleotide-binding universal stress UspA family protein